MKRFVNLVFISLYYLSLHSQDVVLENQYHQKVEVYYPQKSYTTFALQELTTKSAANDKEHYQQMNSYWNIRNHQFKKDDALSSDPVRQETNGHKTVGAPSVNFEGLSGPYSPLDPTGAASSNYFVQAINFQLRVYDKQGNPLVSAIDLSSIWPNSIDEGDPIVMYDKFADRWFISQINHFAGQGPYKLLVAVSTTSDPTGSYFAYEYEFTDVPDFPKYSVWWDGYYFTINAGSAIDGTGGVMDRAKMLAGDPSASIQIVSAPNLLNGSNMFISMLPAYADGSLPPNGSPCYFFNLVDDAWGGGNDGIDVYKMSTNWSSPSSTVIGKDGFIPVSAFTSDFVSSNGLQVIPQKGTSFKLDVGVGSLQFRAPHRVWVGYNSVVLCHVVDANGSQLAGVRWYELRQNGAGSQWKLHQEGTYALSGNESRFFPSIAMDDFGNIALAYCVSGPDTYPSIRFTGRNATDSPGIMTIAEVEGFTGKGSQSASVGGERYGDYSHLSLDPDGVRFWHTGCYVKSNGEPGTRIFSFRLDSANTITDKYHKDIRFKIAVLHHNEIRIDVTGLFNNDILAIDLFDVLGKLILHKTVKPVSNGFSSSIPIIGVPEGVYLVRFGNKNFQKVIKIVAD